MQQQNQLRKGRNVRVRDGQWHYRFNFRGKEYTGPTDLAGDASNRSAAEQFAADRRRELEHRKPAAIAMKAAVLPLDAGFAAVADAFLKWCRDTEYRSKPGTAERLRVSFTSLMDFFGDIPVRQIDAEAIERFKGNRATVDQVRDVTIRHDLHALSVFFRKFAGRRGLAAGNPVKLVSIPSDREAIREHVVTPEEEQRYFAAAAALHAQYAKSFKDAQPNLADVARLMLEQGCRPEEILAARKEHVSLSSATLFIAGGKTRAARRTLHLTAASLAILKRRLERASEYPWLFPSDRHEGRHITKLSCTHDRVCREAGVSFRLYDFRHTFATRAIEDGAAVAIVAAILGHSGLRTIHRYVHPSAEAQKATMERLAQRRAG